MIPPKHIFVVISFLGTVYAQPRCQIHQEKEVVCSAGDDDYVLRRGLVSDNNKFTGITLRDCRITDVDYEAFHHDDNLKYIDLSKNSISRLKLGVMDGSPQVTFLNLSYNVLTTFPLGLFDAKPNLEVLDLKGNRLNLLELGVLDPFRKLVHLDLSSNSLLGKDMNSQLFRNCHQIRFVDFSRNDMSGAPDNLIQPLTNIDFLNLDRCSLKDVPTFATRPSLKSMTHLMLSTNQISRIEPTNIFSELDNLQILNLADNTLEEINEDPFKSMKKLKMVVLRNNRLKIVPDNLFLNLKAIDFLDLSYNFIEYVPINAFRGTSLKHLDLSHNRFSFLPAKFCKELKDSGAMLKKFYFNDNPWQCACLNEILQELKTHDIEYNSIRYNGAYAVCVTTSKFTCKRQMNENVIFKAMYENTIGSLL